ncbi:hypothetical protein RQP46_002527 [Phenoliferia psychrophenolica]
MLAERLANLESELAVWKLGHREAVKDREGAEKQIRDLTEGDPIALCLLDGDGCIFERSLIAKGRDGGREAALALAKHITTLADKELGRSVQVVVNCFYNRAGLCKILSDVGIASIEVVNHFVLGFNAAHPLFTMTDVGPQKEAADAKFRETLRLYARLPSCKLILAGCTHDGGYASPLQSLETEGLFSKVHLLKSYTDMAFELKRLNLRDVTFPGLFETKKLVSFAGHTRGDGAPTVVKTIPGAAPAPPATPAQLKKEAKKALQLLNETPVKTTTAVAKLAFATTPAPASPAVVGFTAVVRKQKQLHTKQIDPKKALSKQTPPPCNLHYLSAEGCFRPNCHYSHEYMLNAKQLTVLRQDAKRSPCADALYGRQCDPENCLSGHVCPFSSSCRYGDSCRFSAPGMHPNGRAVAASGSDSYSEDSFWIDRASASICLSKAGDRKIWPDALRLLPHGPPLAHLVAPMVYGELRIPDSSRSPHAPSPEEKPLLLHGATAAGRRPPKTMARASFSTLPLELKARIVEMVNDQEDAWKRRVKDAERRIRAGHIDCLSSVALVNKELRALAAKHQFRSLSSGKASKSIFRFRILPRYDHHITDITFYDSHSKDGADRALSAIRQLPALRTLHFGVNAATWLFGPGVTLNENLEDEEASDRAAMLKLVAAKIKSLVLHDFKPSEAIGLVRAFSSNLTTLGLFDLKSGAFTELSSIISTLNSLENLSIDLDAESPGWPIEALAPLEHNPPPIKCLQLLYFPFTEAVFKFVGCFSSTIETLTLELKSPEDNPIAAIHLPRLTNLHLTVQKLEHVEEVTNILIFTPIFSLLTLGLPNSGNLDPSEPALLRVLDSQPSLRQLKLGSNELCAPFMELIPPENLASPSSLAAYADLIHSHNLDPSVLDKPHLTPFHPNAHLDYTENEGEYLAEALDRTLDFGRTELKRMVAEGRAASAVDWVAGLQLLENKRLAWKD